VYEVTNLNDSGPGSLRDAVSKGNRTVVFRVSGTIELKKRLVVTQPNLTIAGQTAPGDGICLRNFTFAVASRNVIVRYLRSRLGDVSRQEDDSMGVLHGASNVIFDHCSASWSIDEALSLSGNETDVTIQWCIIAEPLNNSLHAKGPHGYGSLARSNGRVSLHHNLWAHCDGRNPRLGDNYGRPPYPTFDVRNNVIYDYGRICSGLTQGVLKVNYVGNYIRPGPSSKAKFPVHVGAPSDMQFYIKDNIFESNDKLTANNALFFDALELAGKRQVQTVAEPFQVLPVRTQSAKEAFEAVLAVAGASLPARDAVDQRIVEQVRKGTGKIIDSQSEVGGWPELKSAPPPLDSDHDGMPDEWESRHGLDPKDPSDAAQSRDKNGYTNLEHYLNRTDPNGKIDYRDPKNNIHTLHQPLLSKSAGPDQDAKKPGKTVKQQDLPRPDRTVAVDGSGDFKSIQAAVASVPRDNRERIVIYVKDGVYKEKLRVDPSYITLRGQSRKGTRLEFAELKDDFLKNPDKIGQAVINVNGNDFVVENMTVVNTAGVVGQHAFTIYGRGDRTVLLDSDILSDGADTVALWLGQSGRYYHTRCAFRGAVDFLCPRGWCYISDSTFFETKSSAAVWHDGSGNKDMKFVLRHCSFDGVKGWYLARHHHDAQFFFLDCTFSATMIDRAPFRVIYPLNGGKPDARDNKKNADLDKTNRWGERTYFWNCHRSGGDYAWHQDNLKQAPGSLAAEHITAAWTFGGQWDPENATGPVIRDVSVQGSKVELTFSESVTVKGKPRLVLADGELADYESGSGSAILVFTVPAAGQGAGVKSVDLNGGAIFATEAAATLRLADLTG
jgi:pectate lyase